MESKQAELIETESEWWFPGADGWERLEVLIRGYKLSVIRFISPGDLMYSMMTRVNNTVLLLESF